MPKHWRFTARRWLFSLFTESFNASSLSLSIHHQAVGMSFTLRQNCIEKLFSSFCRSSFWINVKKKFVYRRLLLLSLMLRVCFCVCLNRLMSFGKLLFCFCSCSDKCVKSGEFKIFFLLVLHASLHSSARAHAVADVIENSNWIMHSLLVSLLSLAISLSLPECESSRRMTIWATQSCSCRSLTVRLQRCVIGETSMPRDIKTKTWKLKTQLYFRLKFHSVATAEWKFATNATDYNRRRMKEQQNLASKFECLSWRRASRYDTSRILEPTIRRQLGRILDQGKCGLGDDKYLEVSCWVVTSRIDHSPKSWRMQMMRKMEIHWRQISAESRLLPLKCILYVVEN